MTQEAMCGSVRYREAEATAPACLPLPLQNLRSMKAETRQQGTAL
jgi:hypothetical protein